MESPESDGLNAQEPAGAMAISLGAAVAADNVSLSLSTSVHDAQQGRQGEMLEHHGLPNGISKHRHFKTTWSVWIY